jgi:hypothetical protein
LNRGYALQGKCVQQDAKAFYQFAGGVAGLAVDEFDQFPALFLWFLQAFGQKNDYERQKSSGRISLRPKLFRPNACKNHKNREEYSFKYAISMAFEGYKKESLDVNEELPDNLLRLTLR